MKGLFNQVNRKKGVWKIQYRGGIPIQVAAALSKNSAAGIWPYLKRVPKPVAGNEEPYPLLEAGIEDFDVQDRGFRDGHSFRPYAQQSTQSRHENS